LAPGRALLPDAGSAHHPIERLDRQRFSLRVVVRFIVHCCSSGRSSSVPSDYVVPGVRKLRKRAALIEVHELLEKLLLKMVRTLRTRIQPIQFVQAKPNVGIDVDLRVTVVPWWRQGTARSITDPQFLDMVD